MWRDLISSALMVTATLFFAASVFLHWAAEEVRRQKKRKKH